MTKDEMKNKISMALKDPILQQGFEIICKDLAELEKENAELEYQLTHRNCLDCSNHSSKLRMRTLELEKKLTKAKEIIKDLLSLCEGETDSKLVFTRAEQFLSEVEK